MPALNVKMYSGIKPGISYSDLYELAARLERLLGPAIPDGSAWGLERPGLVGLKVVEAVYRTWRVPRPSVEVPWRPRLMGPWIVFDYLFSKTAKANPLITCLTSLGLAKYGKVVLKNTYLVTAGLSPGKGIMIFLYKGGPGVEKDLDNLAYVISHMMKAHDVKKAVLDLETLANAAYELNNSVMWRWVGWVTKEGETIPGETVKSRWKEEYEEKLRRGEWRSLEFEGTIGRIKLSSTERRKTISVIVKKKVFKMGSKRDLKPVFDELSRILKPNRFTYLSPDQSDEAGILRAYTERRGIVAAEYVVRGEYGVNACDVSYEFKGYDIEAGENKIEVKAFRDGMHKTIELTENEYEKMREIEGYKIFVVEDAWDDNPRVNVIEDPRSLILNKRGRDKPRLTIETETYYECEEARWREKVDKTKFGKV
jgi:hypothetical protein